jgi:hypothetical protein
LWYNAVPTPSINAGLPVKVMVEVFPFKVPLFVMLPAIV